jgi:hypothetical protein
MGQTAAQIRDEIIQLRARMADHVVRLKTAGRRPVRVAKFVLIIGGGLAFGGIALVVTLKLRQRARARSPMGRLRSLTDAPREDTRRLRPEDRRHGRHDRDPQA